MNPPVRPGRSASRSRREWIPPSAAGSAAAGALWIFVNASAYVLLAHRFVEPKTLSSLRAILTVTVGFGVLTAAFRPRGWSVGRMVLLVHALAALLAYGSVLRPLPGFSRLAIALFLGVNAVLFARVAFENASRSGVSLRTWIAAASFVVYAGAAIFLVSRTNTEGDEPHYLLATHSLVADGDFDLKNNYRERDYASFYQGEIEERHVLVNRRNEDVPIHDVGLAILLAPGYAARRRPGALIELSLVGALLALGIYDVSRQIGASRLAGARAWAFFAFTSPLLVYSSQIYPDVGASACGVWSVAAFARYRRTGSGRALLAAGSLLALLPWLSVRYWLLVAPLGLAMAISAVRGPAGRGSAAARLLLLASPGVVSILLFGLFDLRWYQTAAPNGGYVLYVLGHHPPMFSPQYVDVSLLGLFFDRAFGLLPTAPVYVLAIAGAFLAWKSSRWIAVTILAAAGIFFLFAAANQFWYGGWAPPPRYVVPAVALLAPLASLVLERERTSWLTRIVVAASAAVAVFYTAAPETRLSHWDLRPGALAALLIEKTGVDYGVALPSFIRAEPRDYVLMIFWAAAAALAIRSLLRAARRTEPVPAAAARVTRPSPGAKTSETRAR